jgi:hypothetical protein
MCEWVGAVAGIVGTVVGVALTERFRRKDLKRRSDANWSALRVEIERCAARAKRFIDHDKPAPLGRFPMETYERVMGDLVAERAVKTWEIGDLDNFYDHVEQLNLGLDQARAARALKDDAELQKEHRRNKFKALRIINISRLDAEARARYPDVPLDTGETARAAEYYDPANKVLKNHGF